METSFVEAVSIKGRHFGLNPLPVSINKHRFVHLVIGSKSKQLTTTAQTASDIIVMGNSNVRVT